MARSYIKSIPKEATMWIKHDDEREEGIDCLLQTIGDGLAWYGWRWVIGNAAASILSRVVPDNVFGLYE